MGRKRVRILVAEDNRADAFLIRESIEKAGLDADLEFAVDGEQAIQLIEQADRDPSIPCPSMLVLDLNLPKRHGREVLQRMRESRCGHTVVLVVTSSNLQRDRDEMGRLGAQEYFCKPSDYESFLSLGGIIKRLLRQSS